VIATMGVRLLRVPLGGMRGGSGATEVEVVVVALADREGRVGTGFTYSLTGGAVAVAAMVDRVYRAEVVGTAILDWDRTWNRLWDKTHRLGRGVALPALSAIDIAVWDLRAQAADLPLFRLLGPHRDAVPVYGSGRSTNAMSVDEGFRAVVPRTCVGDRETVPHDASLYDIQAKYGDVVELTDVIAHLDRIEVAA
jgi:L-alanine-DL-glutamate epimerase-like enolase superfamily enzyme